MANRFIPRKKTFLERDKQNRHVTYWRIGQWGYAMQDGREDTMRPVCAWSSWSH